MKSSDIVWARQARSGSPMGQQVYEDRLLTAMEEVTRGAVPGHVVSVGPWRDRAASTRVPHRIVDQLNFRLASSLGRKLYGEGPVHRFDLRLPPSPKEVITVHDLPPMRFADEGRLPRHAKVAVQRALTVVTPSRFAAAEVERLLEAPRIIVIPNGVDDVFLEQGPPTNELLAELGVASPYVVHAGGTSERKNLGALAEAWRRVCEYNSKVQLVLVGPHADRRRLLFQHLARTRLVGYQTPSTVAALMAGARAVVVPSTYEGFGLPALEGMATGAPVVASRAGALPEVCGDAGVLVVPDAHGIAEGILRVLDDDQLAASLSERGRARAQAFSWRSTALHLIDLYRDLGWLKH